jgi:hypothetical protein
MPRSEEYDWIFDFVLQFLESDKFDAAIMDFVDEKCFVFEDNDENKLIYTDIHKEFCEHVDALLTSNLGEVGITNDQFLESCEKARSGRDINATVFERLVAMDDFQTFKKIMTKRNTELQLEAIKSFQVNTPYPSKGGGPKKHFSEDFKSSETTTTNNQLDPEELLALKEAEIMELQEMENLHEEEMQELLFQSLMEMELIHRQAELEHAELERALMLSLLAEEERLRAMMIDAKSSGGDGEDGYAASDAKTTPAESKSEEKSSAKGVSSSSAAAASVPSSTTGERERDRGGHEAKKTPIKKIPSVAPLPDNLADIKPLKLKSELKPLPSIKGTGGPENNEMTVADLMEKKKLTEAVVKRSNEQLVGQRKNEEELRSKLNQMDPAEIERRERHMKEQRDLLVAKKKAEREAKVVAEEERKRKAATGDSFSDEKDSGNNNNRKKAGAAMFDSKNSGAAEAEEEEEEVAEMRRTAMRMALARRLKMDLLESEEAKRTEIQENQFTQLDKKLQQVEQLREDNRKREYILNKQLERQQEQIARNIELSAAAMNRND